MVQCTPVDSAQLTVWDATLDGRHSTQWQGSEVGQPWGSGFTLGGVMGRVVVMDPRCASLPPCKVLWAYM